MSFPDDRLTGGALLAVAGDAMDGGTPVGARQVVRADGVPAVLLRPTG